MSRSIAPKPSVTLTEEETILRKTAGQGKLLFTSYRGQRCALAIQNGRLTEASFFPRIPSKIGSVYIGKVKSIVRNINACFVEIEKGELCFLSLKELHASQPWNAPRPLNRTPDGRLLEGDEILVQVTRDAQKSKRASVTAQISLSNEYFVLSMGAKKTCYSTKLGKKPRELLHRMLSEAGILDAGRDYMAQDCQALLSEGWRSRLKSEGIELDSFVLPSTGMIVRTKAEEQEIIEEEKLLEQFYDLAAQYIRLLYFARYRSCFSCLRKANTEVEATLEQFSLNALENPSPEEPPWEIITDQPPFYEQLMLCRKERGLGYPVRLYQDSMLSLSALYGIEGKLKSALDTRIWLKSGGYLVIEPTEALTVIDVNSGKCEDGKNPEDTYRGINLEAAEEVAFQLRLRNLSGIIIVDFINMKSPSDNAQLLHVLKSLVKHDKVKTTVVDMTPLGLVEITRKKISKPLREQLQFKEEHS